MFHLLATSSLSCFDGHVESSIFRHDSFDVAKDLVKEETALFREAGRDVALDSK